MKTNKPNRASNRDRSYWEAPRSALQIEAHIEEIDFDNPAPVRRPARDTWLTKALRNRRVRGGAAIGGMAVLFAAVSVGPLASSTPTPSASPSAARTAQATNPIALVSPDGSELVSVTATDTPIPDPTETPFVMTFPTDTPTPTQAPTPTPGPLAGGKWPLTLHAENVSYDGVTVGPDGTVYLSGVGDVDRSGKPKGSRSQGKLPDGTFAVPDAFGPDGTAYVDVPGDADQSNGADLPDTLYAYGTDGKALAGWPVEVPANSSVAFGPGGTIYAIGDLGETYAAVTVLTTAGKQKSSWTFSNPGSSCGWDLRPDGTLFFSYAPNDGGSECAIRVIGPAGQALSKTAVRSWSDIEMSPTGTVVALGYDLEPYSTTVVARTRIAIIGTDGLPVAGWPMTFDGAVSGPAFGTDGTIYLSEFGIGTSPSKVIALDPSGTIKPGWPVALPAGYAPMASVAGIPQPPVPGAGGTVYVPALDNQWLGFVMAYDQTGVLVPGWPYQLPQAFASFNDGERDPGSNPGPIFLQSKTGAGLLYLVLDDRIVALTADGSVAPGWPFALSGVNSRASWGDAQPTPDGGLVVVAYLPGDPQSTAANDDSWTIYDLLPSGAMSK